MLKPADLRNPTRQSGYDRVGSAKGPNNKAPLWRARHYAGPHTKGNSAGIAWTGPVRSDPKQAAQDFCDYMNGNGVKPAPKLKSAGHSDPRTAAKARKRNTAAHRELLRTRRKLRQLEAVVRAESKGSKGYVYCIGELPMNNYPPQQMWHNGRTFNRIAVKVGFAQKSPYQRLRELQTGNPRKLVLLGYFRGTLADEARVHRDFIHQNVLQEWFRPTPALLSLFKLPKGSV